MISHICKRAKSSLLRKNACIANVCRNGPWYMRLLYRFLFWWRWRRFKKFTIPIVKRNDWNLSVDRIVSVQPMTKPVSEIFFEAFKCDKDDKS